MKLLVFVLNNKDKLENLMIELSEAGIRGATILESSGMAQVLTHSGENDPLIGYLRSIIDTSKETNKTILFVVEDNEIVIIREVIKNVVGDLSEPQTGILFTVPVDFTDGIQKKPKSY